MRHVVTHGAEQGGHEVLKIVGVLVFDEGEDTVHGLFLELVEEGFLLLGIVDAGEFGAGLFAGVAGFPFAVFDHCAVQQFLGAELEGGLAFGRQGPHAFVLVEVSGLDAVDGIEVEDGFPADVAGFFIAFAFPLRERHQFSDLVDDIAAAHFSARFAEDLEGGEDGFDGSLFGRRCCFGHDGDGCRWRTKLGIFWISA